MKTPEETLTQWVSDRIVLDGGKGYSIWTRHGIKIIAYAIREANLSMQPQGIRDGGVHLRSPMWDQAFVIGDGFLDLVRELKKQGVSRHIVGIWVARFETWEELTTALKGLFWK